MLTRRSTGGDQGDDNWRPRPRPTPLPSRLTEAERTAHDAFVDKLGDDPLWRRG